MSPDGRQRRSLGQLRNPRVGVARGHRSKSWPSPGSHRTGQTGSATALPRPAIAGLGLAGAGAVAMTGVAHEANPAATGISSTAGAPDDAGSTGRQAGTLWPVARGPSGGNTQWSAQRYPRRRQ